MADYTRLNRFMIPLLRSPLHRLVGASLCLLSVTGSRTGRTYTFPVAYLQRADEVILTTDDRWWRNLAANPTVGLRIRGREMSGVAQVVTDPNQVADALEQFTTEQPKYAERAEIPADESGRPTRETLLASARAGRVLVRIRTTEEAR